MILTGLKKKMPWSFKQGERIKFMEQYMWIVWLAVFVISILIEATTMELVSIFFCAGSLVALIVSFIPGVGWWVEVILFVVISGASLLGLRPLMNKILKKQKRDTNIDELIGKKGLMIKGCDELNHGEIKVNGVIWTAISENDEIAIEANSKVVIVGVIGNKLVVKKEGQ